MKPVNSGNLLEFCIVRSLPNTSGIIFCGHELHSLHSADISLQDLQIEMKSKIILCMLMSLELM
jgi:hypothetical protein